MRRILTALMACALLAPSAAVANGDDVLRDCTDDGRLSKRYSQQEYRQALRDIPADVDEYTDCRDVIRRAQLAGAGGSGGSGSSGTGALPGGGGGPGGGAPGDPLATATAEEKAAVARAQKGNTPVEVAGETVRPGTSGFVAQSSSSELPAPLIIVLALLGAVALGAGAFLLRTRVLGRGTHA